MNILDLMIVIPVMILVVSVLGILCLPAGRVKVADESVRRSLAQVPLSMVGGCRDMGIVMMDPGQRSFVTYSNDLPPYHPNEEVKSTTRYTYLRGTITSGTKSYEFLYPEGTSEYDAGCEYLRRLGVL